MMRDAILNFPKQFEWEPEVQNSETRRQAQGTKRFIVCGMGGSALAGLILRDLKPELDIIIHRDYGLPAIFDLSRPPATLPRPGEGKGRGRKLIIASSYSGNTEETISAFEEARVKKLPLVAISIGGKLIELAKQHKVPYIQMPDTGIQPRSALGFSFLAMLKAMGEEALLSQAKGLAMSLNPQSFEQAGKELAQRLKDHVPVIYSSSRNMSVAYNWKIKFNETGKIPAFYNFFPELNHNEMTGFDIKDSSKHLSERFYFLILKDQDDHPKILKRIEALVQLYHDRGIAVEILEIQGTSRFEKIFSSLLLADWTALHTAQHYELEPEAVPMVEEFKKLIAKNQT